MENQIYPQVKVMEKEKLLKPIARQMEVEGRARKVDEADTEEKVRWNHISQMRGRETSFSDAWQSSSSHKV